MAGLELMFIDGGVTAGAVATAAAGWLGFKQRAEDGEELATTKELPQLCQDLEEKRRICHDKHSELTRAWGPPLSLFSQRDASNAVARGVSYDHVEVVTSAKMLAERQPELIVLADVYVTQLERAMREGRWSKGLLKTPVTDLTIQLDDMSQALAAHTKLVQLARVAFDSAAPVENVLQPAGGSSAARGLRRLQTCQEQVDSLPVSIIRDKGIVRVGKIMATLDAEAAALLNRRETRLEAAKEWILGPTPEPGSVQVGERYMFVQTAAETRLAGLAAANRANRAPVDVVRIHDTEPSLEVVHFALEDWSIFRCRPSDLREIAGFAPTRSAYPEARIGERFKFVQTTSYEYPKDCVDKETVEVIETGGLWALPAQVRWSSGHEYWVNFEDLRISRRTRLAELQSANVQDRKDAADALEKLVIAKFDSLIVPALEKALRSLLQDDDDNDVRIAAGKVLVALSSSRGDASIIEDPLVMGPFTEAIEARRRSDTA